MYILSNIQIKAAIGRLNNNINPTLYIAKKLSFGGKSVWVNP